jgi:hypothetical protein
MAWEQRGKQTYYYRSARVDGRPCRLYFGGGEAAQLVARSDEERRTERQRTAQSDADYQRKFLLAHMAIGEVANALNLLTSATLLVAGYYRHDRGPWRKRRVPREP